MPDLIAQLPRKAQRCNRVQVISPVTDVAVMAKEKLFDRVQWHEGMLLTPQHVQQQSTRLDALIAGPVAWGMRRLVVDDALLAGGLLRIDLLEAVMPNGMAVHHDRSQAQDCTLELDLSAHAAAMAQGELPIYLVIRRARALRLAGQPARVRPVACELVADEAAAALADQVPRMATDLALVAGELPGSAHICLQLMTVSMDQRIVRRGAYSPPQLAVAAASTLAQRARALAARMRSNAVFLGRQSMLHSSRLEERAAMLERRARLAHLTLNLSILEACLHTPVVKPLDLYLALCAQLGPMAALRPGSVPLSPPPYVHADSFMAFETVLEHLHALAEQFSQE